MVVGKEEEERKESGRGHGEMGVGGEKPARRGQATRN